MGVLSEYFIAPTNDDAATMLDRFGGPGRESFPVAPPRRGLFRRNVEPTAPREFEALYPTVEGGGMEPLLHLGALEVLLTGSGPEDGTGLLSDDQVVASRDEEQWVVCVRDALTAALADASVDDLARLAEQWLRSGEYWGSADEVELAGLLHQLAGLARLARERDHTMYCWVSL